MISTHNWPTIHRECGQLRFIEADIALQFVDQIGEGGSAKVYLAILNGTCAIAIKVFSVTKQYNQLFAVSETNLYVFIDNVYPGIFPTLITPAWYENDPCLLMALVSSTPFPDWNHILGSRIRVWTLLRLLAETLLRLSAHEFMHRDLRLENIYIEFDPITQATQAFRLLDLGFASARDHQGHWLSGMDVDSFEVMHRPQQVFTPGFDLAFFAATTLAKAHVAQSVLPKETVHLLRTLIGPVVETSGFTELKQSELARLILNRSPREQRCSTPAAVLQWLTHYTTK
jgi:serine/threonine protein kinase